MLRWLKEAALVRIEPAPAQAERGAPAWDAALAAAVPALEQAAARSAGVRFIVSDHFVRYLALDWDASLGNETERAAYLRHHFEAVYGPRAADWRFAFDREGGAGDATRIAAALDRALVEALGEAAARAGLALAAIEPFAVATFNRLRRALPAPECFLAVAEPGRLSCLLVREGAPRRIASQRSAGAPQRMLVELLAAEAIEAGIAGEAGVAVCLADWDPAAPGPVLKRQDDLHMLLGEPRAQEAAA